MAGSGPSARATVTSPRQCATSARNGCTDTDGSGVAARFH
jgi:hypothetical protein